MTDEGRADFRVLGPLRVIYAGAELSIATRRQRALLVLLLMHVGRVVSTERLIDQLWDGKPPPQAAVTLRSYVSGLRQALGGRDGLGSALVTRGQGYCIDVPPESVDAIRLRRLAEQGREHLHHRRPQPALDAFDAAIGSWSGDPLAEISDHEVAQSTIASLTENYLGAAEGRFEALLANGRHADALPALEAFTTDHPLREEPRLLHMLALYRSGRAAEALAVNRRFRALLNDELGLDPSMRFEQLTQQILRQDPTLDPPHRSMHQTTATTAPPTPAPRPGQAIVGRAHELGLLRTHLDALLSTRTGSLLLVSGEPGIGKTTMLGALQHEARAHGVAVHTGSAPAATGAPAFWPWSQVVDSMAAGLDGEALRQACAGNARAVSRMSATVAERIGHPAPVTGGSPQTLRFLLYEAVSAFIARAAGDDPLVIVIDDLQWADLSSLELLSYLTPSLGQRPLLVVAAYRDVAAERTEPLESTLATVWREGVTHDLSLSGLTVGGIAQLADDVLGASDEPAIRSRFVALLHERTGGNPFFVRQLVRLLLDSGSATTDPSALPVPPGVRHVVARRLTNLAPPVGALLAAAAVIGREFDLQTAAAAAALPPAEALDAFDEAARHGLVELAPGEAGRRRFVHALVQEVVLDRLPAGRAGTLHAAIGRQLERNGSATAEELARHMWAAREVVGPAAIPAQLAAADVAAGLFAYEQAESHLRRALTLAHNCIPPDPSTELTVLLELFRLIAVARGWGDEDAVVLVDRAMKLAQAAAFDDNTAPLWWLIFNFLLDRNLEASYVEVGRILLTAVDGGAASANSASRGAVHLMSVFANLALDDRTAARVHLRQARECVEAASYQDLATVDEHLHISVLLTEGYWAALSEDIDAHQSATNAAIALADADGRPFPRAVARTMSAVSASYLQDVDYAQTLASQALDMDQRFGFGWLETVAASVDDWASAALPDADIAESTRSIEKTLTDMVAAGHQSTQSTVLLLLADAHRAAARTADARKALLRARESPGPYRGLFVDLVARRLGALECTSSPHPTTSRTGSARSWTWSGRTPSRPVPSARIPATGRARSAR